MKILVCLSKAPDTTSRISFVNNNTQFNTDKVQFILNPYDEWYALVRAIELKEKFGATICLLMVGGSDMEAIMRKALALGGDEAVRIDAAANDSYFVASQIAAYATGKNFDIVLCGKETIDFNGSQVAGMVAGLLDLPFISLASKLDWDGNSATVERDVSGGKEILEIKTPFVLSAAKGMAEQRIPNMRGIMAARSKPITVIPATTADELTAMVAFEIPAEKKGCKMIAADQAETLVSLLHEEAKVI